MSDDDNPHVDFEELATRPMTRRGLLAAAGVGGLTAAAGGVRTAHAQARVSPSSVALIIGRLVILRCIPGSSASRWMP